MAPINSVAVFCGSRMGANPAHEVAARALGAGLAAAGIRLVKEGGADMVKQTVQSSADWVAFLLYALDVKAPAPAAPAGAK